jgi:AraC-like DNA-binding protein
MYASGFNNKAYFYREFFKKYNTTPKDFRASRSDPKN